MLDDGAGTKEAKHVTQRDSDFVAGLVAQRNCVGELGEVVLRVEDPLEAVALVRRQIDQVDSDSRPMPLDFIGLPTSALEIDLVA